MDLDVTLNRISDLTLGDLGEDLFVYMQHFFERDDIQRKMVEMNQERLYLRHEEHDGGVRPRYSKYTLEKRRNEGYYTDSSKLYHSYEEGDLFRSFGVIATHEGASILSDESGEGFALGVNINGTDSKSYDTEHIKNFFDLYDPDGDIMGLNDEEISSMKEEMTEHVLTEIKNYLTNGHNS